MTAENGEAVKIALVIIKRLEQLMLRDTWNTAVTSCDASWNVDVYVTLIVSESNARQFQTESPASRVAAGYVNE